MTDTGRYITVSRGTVQLIPGAANGHDHARVPSNSTAGHLLGDFRHHIQEKIPIDDLS